MINWSSLVFYLRIRACIFSISVYGTLDRLIFDLSSDLYYTIDAKNLTSARPYMTPEKPQASLNYQTTELFKLPIQNLIIELFREPLGFTPADPGMFA